MSREKTDFDKGLDRLMRMFGCVNMKELADVLEVRPPSITQAKRREKIPDSWLMTALKKTNANPFWILNGVGKMYLIPTNDKPLEL